MHFNNTPSYIYTVFILLSLLTGFITIKLLNYPKRQNGISIKYILPVLIFGAVIGSKLLVLFSYGFNIELLWTGKSYFGGILGAFIAINIFKYIYHIKGHFGDYFVIPLCFSAAVGKTGCFLYGCCSGTPTEFVFKVKNKLNIFVHPVQIYEILFQVFLGILFIHWFKKEKYQGHFFIIYILCYSTFRLMIEFIRIEPRVLWDLTVYQWTAILFIPYFSVLLTKRLKHV